MKKIIKVVFFDIGGTLIIKEKKKPQDLKKIAEMMVLLHVQSKPEDFFSLVKKNEKEYKSWSKRTLAELPLKERWTRFLGSSVSTDLIEANASKLQYLWGASKGSKIIDPDAVSTLTELARRGYKLGTISHTSPRFLEGTGILELMSTRIHATAFGKRKPHPSLFLAAARECGLRPEECAYVGDRPSRDVIGSREAGISQVIIIASKEREPETELVPMEADHTISRLPQLLDLFPELSAEIQNDKSSTEPFFLYDAAISTMWGIRDDVPLSEFFVKARKLGFARFELNHNIPPTSFEQLNQNQYHVGSVHDPCPAIISTKELDKRDWLVTSLDESLRIKGVDVIKRTISQAVHLCASNVVIHPGRITGDHSMDAKLRELYRAGQKGTPQYEDLLQKIKTDRSERGKPHLEALLKSISELIEFTRPTGLSLGLENRFYIYELPIFNEMKVILETFSESWIGWHLDVGHAQVHQALGLTTLDEWLENFSKRIIAVHLHDVNGIEDHLAPGCGDIDFKKIASYLPEFAYRTLEVRPSLSEKEIRSGMEALVSTGCIARI